MPPAPTICKARLRAKPTPAAPGSLRGLARASFEPKETLVLDLDDGRPPRTVTVQYPKELPDEELHKRMAAEATIVFCSSCSVVEAQPNIHRCHGADVVAFLNGRYGAKIEARGMHGANDAELCHLCDTPSHVHISRALPRGTATTSRGVGTTQHPSRYGNPFIITKDGFTLGESMALFHYYSRYANFRKLEPYLIKLICKVAFVLSDDPVGFTLEIEQNSEETIKARYRQMQKDLVCELMGDLEKLTTPQLKEVLAHVENRLGPEACAAAYAARPALSEHAAAPGQ